LLATALGNAATAGLPILSSTVVVVAITRVDGSSEG